MSKEVMAEAEHPPAKDYHDPPPAPLLDLGELMLWSFYRALIAEFIATLLFLYVTVATVIGYKAQSQDDQCGGVGILGIAWAFGGMIFILVYCTAGISGSGFISLSTPWILEEVPLVLSCCLLLIRWTHKPGRHVGSVPGAEGVAAARGDVHGGAVLGGHMRCRDREGHHEAPIQRLRRRGKLCSRRILQGHRVRRREHRHLRARLHRPLRHRPQAQRPRLPRPGM